MYFDLNDEQQQIKTTAREFLAARYKSERIRELLDTELGFEESDWKEMVELGWGGPASPYPRSTVVRVLGSSSWRLSSRRWATRSPRGRCSPTPSSAWRWR